MLTNKTWWYAALIRAAKTVAQTAFATIGTTALITEVNWIAVLSASALAGVLSLLTSLAGLPEVDMAEAKDEKKEADPEIRIVRVDGDSADEMDYTQEGNIYFLNNEE